MVCAFILILCLAVPAFASKKRSSQKKKSSPKKNYPIAQNHLVDEMLRHLGVKYRFGGDSTGGLDCSGYVGLVYRNVYGLDLPHQSGALFVSSGLQKISLDELETGDLVFFTSSKKNKRINHVGIYLSEGRFVHAARGQGVVVSDLDKQYWTDRIAGARRVPEPPSSNERFDGLIAYSALSPAATTLSDYRDRDRDGGVMSHALGLELGKESPLQIALFQDVFLAPRGNELEGYTSAGFPGPEGGPTSAFVQELRFQRDLRPFSWLVVTPSLSYFNYEGGLDETGLPKRSIGVDLSLGSKEEGWRISTGFRYSSLSTPKGLSEEDRLSEGFDFSVTYSKKISDLLSFSVVGERLQRYDILDTKLPLQEKPFEDQRFSILFNFSY